MPLRNRILCSAIVMPTIFSFVLGLIPMNSVSAQVRRERPTTQGEKLTQTSAPSEPLVAELAVDSLKQSGTYDSLVDAYKKAVAPKSGSESSDLFYGGRYEEQTLIPADGNLGQTIGTSVAISGNTAVVGSDSYGKGSLEKGAAYVFVRDGNTWTQQAKLTASDGLDSDGFGMAVAISGDSIAVGSPYWDSATDWNDGAVYVYVRSGDTWTEQSKLTASNHAEFDFFGLSLSFSGDTLVVGSPYRDAPSGSGAQAGVTSGGVPDYDFGGAYVFVRSGTVWSEQQFLLPSSIGPFENFGYSISVSGDTVAIGAPYDDESGYVNRGTVYVYTRSGTTWTQQQSISAPGGTAYEYFGFSTAVDGDTLVVGQPCGDAGLYDCGGAAYVFSRSGSTWSQTQKLSPSTPQHDGYFGFNVSIKSNNVIVAHPGDAVGGGAYGRGSVETFNKSGSTWSRQYRLVANDGAGDDYFGYSTAVEGDTVIVGVPGDDYSCLTCLGGEPFDQGSARIFQTKVDIDTQSSSDGATSDWFGRSVAISGDTAVVGAPLDDIGANVNQGSAYVFIRVGSSWFQQAKLSASDGAALDNFGWSVSIDGDRAIIGAPLDDVGSNADEGSAYVFVRSAGVWSQQQKLNSYYTGAGNHFGWSVSISGSRAAVGEPLYDYGALTDSGMISQFALSGSTWITRWLVRTTTANLRMGWSVAASGDAVAAGAPGWSSERGLVFLLQLLDTFSYTSLIPTDTLAGDNFGWSVSMLGDTVAVGAPLHDTAGPLCPVFALGVCATSSMAPDAATPTNQGAVYVFTGSGTTWSQQQKLTASDGDNNDQFGYSVSTYGSNLLAGAYGDDVKNNADQGAAYLFSRAGTVWTQQRKLTDQNGSSGDGFGWSVGISSSTAVVGAWSDDVSAPSFGQNQGSATYYNWTSAAPTAAGVKLSGKVVTADGRGIKNATVVLTTSSGSEKTVQTSAFGNFSFEDLPVGDTVIIAVRSSRFTFAPQAISLQDDLDGIALRAVGLSERK